MLFNNVKLLERVGLTHDEVREDPNAPILLTGAAADPATGLIVSLGSYTKLDDKGRVSDIKLKYWRQPPYGKSENQNLIKVSFKPAQGRAQVEVDQVWVQTNLVYCSKRDKDLAEDTATQRKVNTILQGLKQVNLNLRKKGPVEDTFAILDHPETGCNISAVTGEPLIMRGLKREGGFDFSLSPYFMDRAIRGKSLVFRNLDENMLKTVLGFRINTLESQKDFSRSREVQTFDTHSGMDYFSGVKFKKHRSGNIDMKMYVRPEEKVDGETADDVLEATTIPNFIQFTLKPVKGTTDYELSSAQFMDQSIEIDDTATLLRVLGAAQRANRKYADREYPTHYDDTHEFELADMIDPLHPAISEDEGGEFLYSSFHGSSFEKRIEEFGDQIGIADVFLHRVRKNDGRVSSVVTLVDFPFATGGPNSSYDGAIPDYLPFWRDVKAIVLTHDHFDHCDGLAYYAKAGLVKEKDVYATPEVKYFLEKKMDFLQVPRKNRPKISVLEGEGAFPIHDEDGILRQWIQYNQNAVNHSARTTPYIVSGWYGDKCVGDAAVYGDGRTLTESGEKFFQRGLRALPDYAKEHGIDIDPGIVDRDLTVVYHDPTSIIYEGHAPSPEEVEENLVKLAGIFGDKGILMAPISTNDAEYTVGAHLAHYTGRDITAVGRNAELRVSCKNLFGMRPDLDISKITIDPFEEAKKPESQRLIPSDILDYYFDTFSDEELEELTDAEDDAEYEKALERVKRRRFNEFRETLPVEERDHIKSVRLFLLDRLMKDGYVGFENDYNDYLRWLAIMERKDISSIRATRQTKLAKQFKEIAGRLMIFVTGTQGNAEERFSTIQKFKDFFSLLDADEKVRPSGYKIDSKEFVAFVTQPPIPGNEGNQELMLRELAHNRDMTVVGAFLNGFKVYNLKDKMEDFKDLCEENGWSYEIKDNSMWVKDVPIHIHGHGFRRDMLKIAKAIPAKFHEVHHIPSEDSYDTFRTIMAENGLNHSNYRPDDFQVFRINPHGATEKEQYTKVAQLNPSYIKVRMHRKFGQFYNGWMELVRTTLMNHEPGQRMTGLMANTEADSFHRTVSARQDWAHVSNPDARENRSRRRRIGPHSVNRGEDKSNRSRSMFSHIPAAFRS